MSEVVTLPGANAPPAKAKRLHWTETPPPNVAWLRQPPPAPVRPEATPERLLLAAMVATLPPKKWRAVIERIRLSPDDTPVDLAKRRIALSIALGDLEGMSK